jgi:hypothetical protein
MVMVLARRLMAGLVFGASACSAGTDAPPTFDIELAPVRDGSAEVTAVDVRWEFRAGPDSLTLAAPIVYAGVTGIADRIERLEAHDREGSLSLGTTDDAAAPGGFPYFRRWRPIRRIAYPLVVSYRARVQPDGERNGPPFSIRSSGGGISGAGPGFLLLPEDTSRIAIRLRWNLADLAPGSIGVTSLGEGPLALDATVERFRQAWFMAGPVGRYPADPSAGFSAFWLGTPPFDTSVEMKWAADFYAYLAREFAYLDPPPPYRVFMRFLAAAPCGGGTALEGSFMLSRCVRAGDTLESGPRDTFAHEMIHQWVGGIEGPHGVTSWFSEGLTTHYTRLLPFRGGFMPVDWYEAQIRESIDGYYRSPGRNLSADSIAALGFGDENIRHVPYHRGALYFGDLDARIRKRSDGKRTLDSLMHGVFVRRHRGEPFDQAIWLATVARELGDSARSQFTSVIIDGKTIAPDPGAFGPCFTRRVRGTGYEWIRVRGAPDAICHSW